VEAFDMDLDAGSQVLSAISTARNLKRRRKERKFSRFDVSERAGISPSFYSELETGRKSASGETLRRITKALDMSIEELQSDRYDAALEALLDFQDPDIAIKEGIELLDKAPHLAKAIPRLLANIARVSDRGSKKEVIYPILLRDFQEENLNHFPELEREAKSFLEEHPPRGVSPDHHDLQGILKYLFKYTLKTNHNFNEHQYQHLPIIRAMWLRKGNQQHLLLNRNLLDSQKAFELAREIAYNLPFLRTKETLHHRVPTSPRLGLHSYTQILNEFKASYFAGAVLMPQELLEADLEAFFQEKRFEPERLWEMMQKYHVTAEMLLHRLTEILPGKRFGIKKLHFLRFQHNRSIQQENQEWQVFSLTKLLNLSSLPFAYGESSGEKYCRRYNAIQALRQMRQALEAGRADEQAFYARPMIRAQRARFVNEAYRDHTYLCLTMARPLELQPNILSSVTIGFVVDEHFKNTVRFWDNTVYIEPEHGGVIEVGHTCQRCPLSAAQCRDRAAEAVIFREEQRQKEMQRLLSEAEKEILS
jgi:XRE family transcriptional regulator, fatty acid utilization regulator